MKNLRDITGHLKKIKFTKSRLKSIPETPGIYIFIDSNMDIIYIGKAKSLKARVRTYFRKNIYGKTDNLVKNISHFTFIKVESEIESILLEAKLIKEYKPYYNLALKDDKGPSYVYVTSEYLPRVLVAKKLKTKSKYIFGPFANSKKLNIILKNIRRIIPYSTHTPNKRVCIYKQIGLCNPCPSEISLNTNVQERRELIKNYKINVNNIKIFFEGNFRKLKNSFNKEMIKYSKSENFEAADAIKIKINMLNEITTPQILPEIYMEDPYYSHKMRLIELKDLKNILNKYMNIRSLNRIECYDISHIQGINGAGSMVTFINGSADKSFYRHFRLRKSSNSDTASLHEIAQRRLKHMSEWGIPDIIIVDGGRAQVNIFREIYKKYKIPIVGIAKRNERLIIPSTSGFIDIKLKNNALKLIQRIRNEAHRFAQRYHHKLVFQTLLNNDNIKI